MARYTMQQMTILVKIVLMYHNFGKFVPWKGLTNS